MHVKKSIKNGGGPTSIKPVSKILINHLLTPPVMQLSNIFKASNKKKNKTTLSRITEDTQMHKVGERQSQRTKSVTKKHSASFKRREPKKKNIYISEKNIPNEINKLEALIIKKKEEILSIEQEIHKLRKRQLHDIDSENLAEQLQNLMVLSKRPFSTT